MSDKKDELGDRIKQYESVSTGRKAFKGQPIVARLDGKNFHNFTRGMDRPFDTKFSTTMVLTMGALVEKFRPKIAYTQSDEINLVFYIPSESKAQYDFGGRFQKYDSILSASASVYFNGFLRGTGLAEKCSLLPVFDARTFVVPNLTEAYNVLLWRQQDATKNAISMAAQSMFSHKRLQKINGKQMQELMFSEKGVNFNNYPESFKRGTFCQRISVERNLSPEELGEIPEKFRPTGPVKRTDLDYHHAWLSKLENPIEFLFENAKASYKIDK